ncbi:vWA domain-containing protein [Hydrogenobacter thermophilus]|uniref:vWA domain-containing protein n=1 Tax=Hydrogenobacter thermophilus TaxID=940 RepID=UPI0030F711CB
MKERWKAIGSLLEGEFDLIVQASYEGWGAGYDPKFLPLLEMWARGELQDIPSHVKKPLGVVFSIPDLLRKSEEYIVNSVRHEISYLLNADLPIWRAGQREFFRFGYQPTAFVVLYAVLESIKADERILKDHPDSRYILKRRYEEILASLRDIYPYHEFALGFLKLWLSNPEEVHPTVRRLVLSLESFLKDYLAADSQQAYSLLMEDVFGKYRVCIEESSELNYIDMLIEEASGKRKEGHKGRIMTDILKKLPKEEQELIKSFRISGEIPQEIRREILKKLKSFPDWMRDYIKQMSYMSLLEKDMEFLSHFLPKTLQIEMEHRGFLSFILKGWEENASEGSGSIKGDFKEESEKDRRYRREFGLNQEEFRRYHTIMRSVMPFVESMKKRFQRLLPESEEGWIWGYPHGRRIDYRRIHMEIPTKRGLIYQRRLLPEKKQLAFKLLLDISSSMKKEDKIENAVKSLLLFSEVLNDMKMPFSIDTFSEKVFSIKSFEEDYIASRTKIVRLEDLLGGGTNIEKALLVSGEDLEIFCKKNSIRGVMIIFSDGEPTKGLRGEPLKDLIRQLKGKFPIVGIGVGEIKNFVEEYFEKTGLKIRDVSMLPSAFFLVMENQFKRLQFSP